MKCTKDFLQFYEPLDQNYYAACFMDWGSNRRRSQFIANNVNIRIFTLTIRKIWTLPDDVTSNDIEYEFLSLILLKKYICGLIPNINKVTIKTKIILI